jgi:phosphoglycerate-specific signal transduction histidine kinase
MNSIFKLLSGKSGAYNLPYLLNISDTIYIVNNNEPVTYLSRVYAASTFTVSVKDDGDSVIQIESVSDDLINLLTLNNNITVDIVGVLNGATVQAIKSYRRLYASATWDNLTATITMPKDDRLEMSIPANIWTTYNNRGNA